MAVLEDFFFCQLFSNLAVSSMLFSSSPNVSATMSCNLAKKVKEIDKFQSDQISSLKVY